MNVSIAKTYFDKNGFIFVITRKSSSLDSQTITIRKFINFNEAYMLFKVDDSAEFANLTQAKQKGWIDNES